MNEKESEISQKETNKTEINKTNDSQEKTQQKRTFSIFKNNKKPLTQPIQTTKPRVIFHFGTGCKFPAFSDPKAPFVNNLFKFNPK